MNLINKLLKITLSKDFWIRNLIALAVLLLLIFIINLFISAIKISFYMIIGVIITNIYFEYKAKS